jgi:hypothetical protein
MADVAEALNAAVEAYIATMSEEQFDILAARTRPPTRFGAGDGVATRRVI